MELIVDPDVKSVLEFMQRRLPTCKLVAVAECLPQMARLLWTSYPQEACRVLALEVPKTDLAHPSQLSATESAPEAPYAGDGSGVVMDAQ